MQDGKGEIDYRGPISIVEYEHIRCFRPLSSSPGDFRALIQQEHAKWSTVIREEGLPLE